MVVNQVSDDTLLIAELKEVVNDRNRFKVTRFGWLPGTWRSEHLEISPIAKGQLLAYLNPVVPEDPTITKSDKKSRRVIDRDDLTTTPSTIA